MPLIHHQTRLHGAGDVREQVLKAEIAALAAAAAAVAAAAGPTAVPAEPQR